MPMKRSEVKEEYKWKMTDIFSDKLLLLLSSLMFFIFLERLENVFFRL